MQSAGHLVEARYNPITGKMQYWDELAGDWKDSSGGSSPYVNVSNSSGDVAAIVAAITTVGASGKVSGSLATGSGQVARITTPTTIALGYTDTENSNNWDTDTTEKVKLSLNILPDPGLGAALTIKGGYGVELDINILGGGARGVVTDVVTTTRVTSADASMVISPPASASTVISPTGGFAASDVGASIAVPGAGAGGATLYTYISSVISPTTVTVRQAASTAVSNVVLTVGTTTVRSPAAIAAGLKPGAVVFILSAGPRPEGVAQHCAASVRSVDVAGGTFVVSEAPFPVALTGATMRWFDVGVRLEDHVGLRVNLYAKSFDGYALAADASEDATKRLRSVSFGRIHGNACGGTMFWKGMEAHGSLGQIWSNSYYGDYFGSCADTHWIHYEGGIGPSASLADSYLWLDRCAQMNGLSISVGDRATEALLKVTGDTTGGWDAGRFSMIRCTAYMAIGSGDVTLGTNTITNVVSTSLTFKVGQILSAPGVPEGAVITAVSGSGNGYTVASPGTITFDGPAATATAASQTIYGSTTKGVRFIGVASAEVGFLDTNRTVVGLEVVGGAGNGIKVVLHRSLTSDIRPLVVGPGSSGVTPRLDLRADYRFHLGYSVDILSGLAAGADLKLSGYLETMHASGGPSGKRAIRSASPAAILDVTALTQKLRSGLLGLVDPATITLRNQHLARLGNDVPAANMVWVSDGAGGYAPALLPAVGAVAVGTSQNVIANTVAETVLAGPYTIPAGSVLAGTAFRLRAWGTVDNDAGATVTIRGRLGGVTGASVAAALAITNASAKTLQSWNVDWVFEFRAVASAATPVAVGGQSYQSTSASTLAQGQPATNVNMTVARDLVLAATWSAATATNVIRCEGFTIEQVK